MTAWSTLGQAVFVVVGIIVALWQLQSTKNADRSRATDELFKELQNPEVDAAIDRISTCIDPREDCERIAELLQRDAEDPLRLQCESDITKLTNLFERINDQFENQLISRERFINIYDEITLFVCHALSQAHRYFDQADYGPLIKIGRRCQANYIAAAGENKNLIEIKIAAVPPRRFVSSKK
jgi:hypothetical protein